MAVGRRDRGVVVYLRATDDVLLDCGCGADARADGRVVAQILLDLGVRSVRLLGEDAHRWSGHLERSGLIVLANLPLPRLTRHATRH
jgi:GTP cyclohydrolase II